MAEIENNLEAAGDAHDPVFDHDIAVIGMVGRFPGASDLDTFWRNLRDGVESIARFSADELAAAGIDPGVYSTPSYVPAGGVIEGIDLFDAAHFGYSPREAQTIDPQQRILLECAWEALEHAGYDAERYAGAIGVYVGVGLSTYLLSVLYPNRHLLAGVDGLQLTLGNDKDYAATRISYKLNLNGPSININTACSTSLVAIHLACQSLLSGECDMALAGGACITVPHKAGYLYREGSIASPDGHCRAFDAAAQGTVGGNGAGVVVLKRLVDALADGDTIHAVVKGSAVNNDGAAKVGYTAPSIHGQARVIREALAMAGVDSATIGYIEAHGTGTPLGDPIEVAALTQAFGQSESSERNVRRYAPSSIALGSAKANIGHLDTAAGVAGFIKTVLALQHKQIPPSLHYQRPNPQIDFAAGPFYVNAALLEWPEAATPRRAGVSSFGIGGTNAHVVLEEAPTPTLSTSARHDHVVVLSARTAAALDVATERLMDYLRAQPDCSLADVAYTLQVGRRAFAHRRMLVGHDVDDVVSALAGQTPGRMLTRTTTASEPRVAFLFPGQGAQYANMGAELYRSEPVFRDTLDQCLSLLRSQSGIDPHPVLFPPPQVVETATEQLRQTALAQPALFSIEYALAQLWMAWGIRPAAMLGHSLGEYVAACLSGVFSLEDALRLVAARGRLMQEMQPGAMLSIALPEEELRPLLRDGVALAAINAPALCVASGPRQAITALSQQLVAQGVECQRLHTSHAFHSAMMDPMLDAFAEQVASVRLHPPTLPFISNMTGTWITAADATDPHYWSRHARQPVHFAAGVGELLADPTGVLLEVGPGRTLATLARQSSARSGASGDGMVLASLPQARDSQPSTVLLMTTLGKLWLAGAPVDWHAFSRGEARRRVPLPTYPFERQRYWIDVINRANTSPNTAETNRGGVEREAATSPTAPVLEPATKSSGSLHPRPALMTRYEPPATEIQRSIVAIWEELLGSAPIGIHDDFFELGGHSLMGTQVVARVREAFPVELPLRTIFEASTIDALASVVGGLLLEKIEALSEEEARLLAE